MQKLGLNQSLQQKLSPQQIQFIKLLQIPTSELEMRIEEELESNPALEEGIEEFRDEKEYEESYSEDYSSEESDDFSAERESADIETSDNKEVNLDEYLSYEDAAGYKMQGDGNYPEEERETPIVSTDTLYEDLIQQLGYLRISDKQTKIGKQLIGTIDSDGYIRRDLENIVDDIAFAFNIETDVVEVEAVLKMIQKFDPPGIAARDLQECLVLQLERLDQKDPAVSTALKMMKNCFEEFKKKHYPKIERRLNITEDELKDAVSVIVKLNPKPGGTVNVLEKTQYVIPDFILRNINGKIEVMLNAKNAPDLRISRSYAEMIESYHKGDKKDKKLRQTISFVKQKLDSAKWFIDAIKQRQQTLLKTMNAILKHQYEFFLDGEETKIKPMILKDIANEIGMDISTVSRVANSKSVQTEFGVFPLKYFFSESIATETGEDVSSKEVKHILKEIIEAEDKKRPLSDDKLEKMLRIRGYQIARRTVAKYREQLNIPVARLRKEI
jgi:RNA polymerase sigma-54 factor